jgi:hypothetical protein
MRKLSEILVEEIRIEREQRHAAEKRDLQKRNIQEMDTLIQQAGRAMETAEDFPDRDLANARFNFLWEFRDKMFASIDAGLDGRIELNAAKRL